jgi:hypothetical protein
MVPWELNSGGDPVWVGPRSLRVFLRENRFFAGGWLAFCLIFATVAWASWEAIPVFVGVPIGLLTGGGGWLGFMFAFSRGWIAEGD